GGSGDNDRTSPATSKFHEGFALERRIAHFQYVPQRPTIQLFGQQVEERAEFVGIEATVFPELPQYRSEAVAELGQSAEHETLDLLARAGERSALDDPRR